MKQAAVWTLKMEATCFSETCFDFHRTASRCLGRDRTLPALPLIQKQVRATGNVGVSELPCDVTPTRSPHVGHCSPLKASERPLDRMWDFAVTSAVFSVASPVVRSDPDVFGGKCRCLRNVLPSPNQAACECLHILSHISTVSARR
jgi:hypothetical protein